MIKYGSDYATRSLVKTWCKENALLTTSRINSNCPCKKMDVLHWEKTVSNNQKRFRTIIGSIPICFSSRRKFQDFCMRNFWKTLSVAFCEIAENRTETDMC